jgi:hypothetical protein
MDGAQIIGQRAQLLAVRHIAGEQNIARRVRIAEKARSSAVRVWPERPKIAGSMRDFSQT